MGLLPCLLSRLGDPWGGSSAIVHRALPFRIGSAAPFTTTAMTESTRDTQPNHESEDPTTDQPPQRVADPSPYVAPFCDQSGYRYMGGRLIPDRIRWNTSPTWR